MKNTFYTLLIVLLAVMNLQAQEGQHVVQVPTPDEGVVVGAIGGTVDVSALGGATYTIPIQVPEGLGGVQPNLSITYNSQSGNGLLGWGWNLGGLSAITRVGRTLYHDGEVCGAGLNYMDRYALDGQRLILIEGEYGGYGAEYKTEVDGMSRIVSHTEDRFVDGPAYFKVYTPEGLTLYYGWDRSGDDNARIVWEHDGEQIVVLWLLKRVEDQNGNYMVYNYCIGGHDYRLDNIQYCANPAVRNEPDNERGTKYGVDFKYSHRDDYETSFIGDYVLHQPWLLENISVHYWENNTRLFDYTFEYDEVSGQMNSEYFYNRLKNINFETADGNGYNETTIDWGVKPSNINNPNIANTDFFLSSVSFTDQHDDVSDKVKLSGDFNGDGLSDFVVVERANKVAETISDSINSKEQYSPSSSRAVHIYLNEGHNKTDNDPGNCNFRCASFENFGNQCYDLIFANINWLYICDFNGDGLVRA